MAFPHYNQSVESAVKIVTEATVKVEGEEMRQKEISLQLQSLNPNYLFTLCYVMIKSYLSQYQI